MPDAADVLLVHAPRRLTRPGTASARARRANVNHDLPLTRLHARDNGKVMPDTQEFRGSPEHAIEELSRMCSTCDLQCSDCKQGCIVTMCIFFPEDALSNPFDMSRRSPAGALAEIAATMEARKIKEVRFILTSPTTPEEHECESWI